jgi:hypothetical protein
MKGSRFWTLTGIVFLAALSRLLPHPMNVTPIAALALFGGARFENKATAFVVPFLAMLLSDFILGFHTQLITVYLSFGIIVLLGMRLRNNSNPISIFGLAVTSSVIFFVLTNFGVWLFDQLYPKTLAGLQACYVAAIPFFRNEALGTLFYSALLFGSFAFAEKKIPELRESLTASSRQHSC